MFYNDFEKDKSEFNVLKSLPNILKIWEYK